MFSLFQKSRKDSKKTTYLHFTGGCSGYIIKRLSAVDFKLVCMSRSIIMFYFWDPYLIPLFYNNIKKNGKMSACCPPLQNTVSITNCA